MRRQPTNMRSLLRTGMVLAGSVVLCAELDAQEISRAEIAAQRLFQPIAVPQTTMWLREEVDPILRQRREIGRMREAALRRAAIARNDRKEDRRSDIGQWHAAIGNTAAGNWSPYPDRELDARTIRFPLPRRMNPDHRTENMKQTPLAKKGLKQKR